jgi:hypothetical protein
METDVVADLPTGYQKVLDNADVSLYDCLDN